MRTWIRRGVGALLALALAAAAAVAIGLLLAERKAQRRIAVNVQPVAVPTDAASLERGRYLFTSRGTSVSTCQKYGLRVITTRVAPPE